MNSLVSIYRRKLFMMFPAVAFKLLECLCLIMLGYLVYSFIDFSTWQPEQ